MAKRKTPLQTVRGLGVRRTPDPIPKRRYCARSEGIRTGLGICQFWATLFEANERLVQRKKMTDAEIKRQVAEEFPGREAVRKLLDGVTTVNYYRRLYNKGRLTSGRIPKLPSRRYGIDGVRVNGRSGRTLTPEELAREDG